MFGLSSYLLKLMIDRFFVGLISGFERVYSKAGACEEGE